MPERHAVHVTELLPLFFYSVLTHGMVIVLILAYALELRTTTLDLVTNGRMSVWWGYSGDYQNRSG